MTLAVSGNESASHPRVPALVPGARYLEVRRGMLAQLALDHRQAAKTRRIAFLVKNLKPSGGNRVIMGLFNALQNTPGTNMHVYVVPEANTPFSGFGAYLSCKRHYGSAASVQRPRKAVDPSSFDVVLSTSRRTLDYVADLAHPNHVHLMQALEAWDTENSEQFLHFCRTQSYPGAHESIELVRRIGIRKDIRYLEQLSAVKNAQTVSDYLAEAIGFCGKPKELAVWEPDPPILSDGRRLLGRDIDVLMFLRGFVYNGDDVTLALAGEFAGRQRRVTVITGNYCPRDRADALRGMAGVEVVRKPSDAALANLYRRARVVIHPSLCNGGGFIPFEALSFGCAVVSSRSGWLTRAANTDELSIVDRHDPTLYLAKAEQFLAHKAHG